MALALQQVTPIARRVLAWWNGVDPPEGVPLPPDESAAAPPSPEPALDSPRKAKLFSDPRFILKERVWGAGFNGPVDAAWVATFGAPLALDSKMSAVNLGAGLGGVTRAMASATGAWVTGYESNPELAEAGMELSTITGLAKRAPIQAYDPANPSLKRNSCNAIVSVDALHTIPDKPALYSAVFEALRLGGHFLFTDYLSLGARRDTPAFQEWLKLEPGPAHLTTPDEVKTALQGTGFDVRIVENISNEMRHLATLGWAKFAEALRKKNFDRRLGAALTDELALWLARLRVMEAGEIGAFRVHAMKPSSKPAR